MDRILDIVQHPLIMPIAVPLVMGALAYVLSRLLPRACGALALLAGAAVLAGGLALWQAGGDVRFSFSWMSLTQDIQLNVDLARTTLGMVVLIGSAGFAVLVSIYSFRAMAGEYWEGKFYAYLIWALGGACIVALAGNLLVLLVGWEIVTLMLFLMISQGHGEARAVGAKAYGVLGFADACLLLAIVMLVAMPGGSVNLELSRPAVSVGSMGAAGYLVYALILAAALAKAGAVPLHTWIPAAAQDAPTPVMAYLPGSLDKLLGIYLLATLVFRFFAPDATMGVVLIVLGAVTLLGAGFMAVMQSNLNKALAFDAVSQVGYMVIGIGVGSWLLAAGGAAAAPLAGVAIAGGLFHMLNHAIYKSSLFLMSGAAQRAAGTAEMDRMGGLARIMPVTFVCGAIASLSAAGVPPFNGFVSKWLVFQGTLGMHGSGALVVLVVAVFASALSLAMFVKILYAVFLSPRPANAPVLRKGGASAWMTAPMIVLAAACVLLGLQPQLALDHLFAPVIREAGATGVAAGPGVVDVGRSGLWAPSQATVLILIGILIGLVLIAIVSVGKKVRVVRPFLAGEVPVSADDRFRVPGTQFYETIARLPLVGPLLRQGESGALDVYHWSSRYGRSFVEMLRAQHTGLLGLYVAWVLIGLIVTLVYLLLSAGN